MSKPELKMEDRNCFTCFYGGDGEEINDLGHCWLHNGDADFKQPDPNAGCHEWQPKGDKEKCCLFCGHSLSADTVDGGIYLVCDQKNYERVPEYGSCEEFN